MTDMYKLFDILCRPKQMIPKVEPIYADKDESIRIGSRVTCTFCGQVSFHGDRQCPSCKVATNLELIKHLLK